MTDLGNKEILSKNLRKHIDLSGKERKDIAEELGFSYSTFTDWINGNSYPRIENILEVYKRTEDIKTKNELLKEILDKVVYTKEKGGRWSGKIDSFTLELYPKLK